MIASRSSKFTDRKGEFWRYIERYAEQMWIDTPPTMPIKVLLDTISGWFRDVKRHEMIVSVELVIVKWYKSRKTGSNRLI